MLRYRFERMFPWQLRKVLEKMPVAYLPVSPLEWHGEHLVFGTDALRAAYMMKRAWKKNGGVLMPTYYIGTDGVKDADGKRLWGMEIPAGQALPGSIFFDEGLFRGCLNGILDFLERAGFKLCVACTGHLAENQVQIMEAMETDRKQSAMKVLTWHMDRVSYPDILKTDELLHAGLEETSEMLAIGGKYVYQDRGGEAEADKKIKLTKDLVYAANKLMGRKRLKLELRSLNKALLDALTGLGLSNNLLRYRRLRDRIKRSK